MTKSDPLADIRGLGNPAFISHVQGMLDTHVKKAAGYAGSDNPDTWANFREAEAWGSTPLLGCFIRLGDKYRRVQNLRRNAANDRVGESIKDTLLDLANYAIIAVCLLEEEEAEAARLAKIEQARADHKLFEEAKDMLGPIPRGGLADPIREAGKAAEGLTA